MLLRSFTLAALAMAACATPIDLEDEGLDGEVQLFKRDAVLSARDLELAGMHGVNVSEMFKHTVIKRNDGDDFTIWVSNNYVEAEGPEPEAVEKRQTARPGNRAGLNNPASWGWRECGDFAYRDITSGTSPFAGGVLAVANWAGSQRGHWHRSISDYNREYNYVIGGSNSGRNARFAASLVAFNVYDAYVGTHDVDIVARKVRNDYQRQFSGRWRVAGEGTMRCTSSDFWPLTFDALFSWKVVSSTQTV